jgi:hypothetical protein
MRRRVTFLRVPKGSHVQGIYGAKTDYINEGDAADVNQGGGRIGRMEMAGGVLYFRKVDATGKPHRDYGTVAIRGGKRITLKADGVAVSAQGYQVLFVDEKEGKQ